MTNRPAGNVESVQRATRSTTSLLRSIEAGRQEHACSRCKFVAKDRESMVSHILKAHRPEKPFACTLCNYKCSLHQTLKHHLQSHTGGEAYDCDMCDYSAPQPYLLENHIRMHTREKPYGCDLCAHRTTTLEESMAHKLTHDEENVCYLCENKYATIPSVNAQMKGCMMCRVHCRYCFQLTTLHLCSLCQKNCIERWTYKRATFHIHNTDIIYNYVKGVLTCKMCTRKFKAKIGYISHMQAHLRERQRPPKQPEGTPRISIHHLTVPD